MGNLQVSGASGGVPTRLYDRLDRLFEHPVVFDAYQSLVDGGKRRQIRRFLRGLPYESVLDVGCGTGNWTDLAHGPYLGVDTSPAYVTACRERFGGDTTKRFILADAAEVDFTQRFDLGLMVSVLHHLSSEKAEAVLRRMATACRNIFILDLYPIRWNPISRLLYALDRGNFIRTPDAQRRIVDSVEGLRILKEGSYYSPTLLYRHTLFLIETPRGRA